MVEQMPMWVWLVGCTSATFCVFLWRVDRRSTWAHKVHLRHADLMMMFVLMTPEEETEAMKVRMFNCIWGVHRIMFTVWVPCELSSMVHDPEAYERLHGYWVPRFMNMVRQGNTKPLAG